MEFNIEQLKQLIDLLADKGLLFFLLWILYKVTVPSVAIYCVTSFLKWAINKGVALYEIISKRNIELIEKKRKIDAGIRKEIQKELYKELEDLCKPKI